MSTEGEGYGPHGPNLGLFAKLAAPFASDEVRTRNQAGRELQYITARTAMNRLDDVLGADNWWDDYQPMESAIICRLTVRLPDGSTLTKTDAGGMSTTQDTSDYEKSGFSDAFKRAAVKFGVGRYLYGDGVPRTLAGGPATARAAHAEPRRSAPEPRRDHGGGYGGNGNGSSHGDGGGGGYGDRPPTSGKALYAWSKKAGEQSRADVVGVVNDYGNSQRWPKKMIDWDAGQVADAHAEAVAFLENLNAAPAPKPARPAAQGRPLTQAGVEAEDFSQVPADEADIPF